MATENKKLNPTAEKIVNYLKAHKGESFTFAEISEAVGINPKSTGSITRLIKSEKNPNGIILHGGEREVEVTVKKKVSTYRIGEPTEAKKA